MFVDIHSSMQYHIPQEGNSDLHAENLKWLQTNIFCTRGCLSMRYRENQKEYHADGDFQK